MGGTSSPSVKVIFDYFLIVHPKTWFSYKCITHGLSLVSEGIHIGKVSIHFFALESLPMSSALISTDTLHSATNPLLHLSFRHLHWRDMISREFLSRVHLTIASLTREHFV